MQQYNNIYRAHSTIQSYRDDYQGQHIAVIGGGMSAEREVSLLSSRAVIGALTEYRTTFIDMGVDIATTLSQVKPDIVFNCLHGTFGEDGCLPALLNLMNIPYTHSGLVTSVLSFNKKWTRNHLLSAGIKCAAGLIVEKGIDSDPMPRPYVLKPLAQGSSIGIHVIFPEDQFNFKEYSFPYGEQVLIEQYIAGKELQVAVLDGKALGVIEIELLKNRFYDYQTKYTDGFANHIFPARLPEADYNYALQLSERIYHLFECRGIARIEFIYEPLHREFYCLELNTHPGMTELSICPELAKYSGYSFEEFIAKILKIARCD